MATIIYLHGFASVGKSSKSDALVEAFGKDHVVVAPDLPFDPDRVEEIIDQLVKDAPSFPIIFVGTSLGGFWALHSSAKYDCPCVLVNPSSRPSKTMEGRVDITVHNFVTGEPIEVKSEHIEKFRKREEYIAEESNGHRISLLVAADDPVIPHTETLANIPHRRDTVVTSDGGHRFEKYIDLIVSAVKDRLS